MATSDDCLRSVQYRLVAADAIGAFFEMATDSGGIVAIDIPIGLSESKPRACDLAARSLLGPPRSSSVFPAPCRQTLAARSFADACELNFAACGRKTTLQTYYILPKIRAVDRAMTPDLQDHVRESHPEVVFARLSGEGHGLIQNKRNSKGQSQRRSLLEKRLGAVVDVDSIRDRFDRSRLQVDDLLDALACLVAASNIASRKELVIPLNATEFDSKGLRMEIVA